MSDILTEHGKPQKRPQSSPLIASISVKGLFGLYNYSLPADSVFSSATILYGDNGVGKSTILRLVFHLLSPGGDKGHRHALYEASFDELKVNLANGVTFKATQLLPKTKSLLGRDIKRLTLTIEKQDSILSLWEFIPRNLRNDAGYYIEIDKNEVVRQTKKSISEKYKITTDHIGEAHYLANLSHYAPNIFILNADRRLDSDAVADPGDEIELRRIMRLDEPRRLHDVVSRSRQIALTQALSSASKWISRKAIYSANRGSENVHSVYINVIKQLTSSIANPTDEPNYEILYQQLSEIETRTQELARYELATPLSTSDLKKSLNARAKQKKRLAAELLVPYIESLRSRLQALDAIYQIIEKFVTTINKNYLKDKYITYKVSQGFSIYNTANVPLEARHLSSGEQQLMLLFCYVLSGRDKPCVFMIDEPEISLNVKWQRQLVQSLLDITDGTNVQFVFASHSMELLAQHRDRVVTMTSTAQ
ncbi:AAA family ATPase [Pseudomonas sp. Irchel 3A18]|uniref:AAA family ATPase n=1 Tax=Pseudomonas sp. Irchel 3A18 TaxID=2008905 RepID=UPI00135B9484|nr:AAA family ATPase [Pseudomonas sp. Irchel 3A18]